MKDKNELKVKVKVKVKVKMVTDRNKLGPLYIHSNAPTFRCRDIVIPLNLDRHGNYNNYAIA